MILSNGAASPVFTSQGENDEGMQSFNIPDYSLVKSVNGSSSGWPVHKLSFKKKDGTEITMVETDTRYPYGQESEIADDEEIIGVFGTKNRENYVCDLGFIVWKPPRI